MTRLRFVLAAALIWTSSQMVRAADVDSVADEYLAAIQEQDWGKMGELLSAGAVYQDFTMEYFDRGPSTSMARTRSSNSGERALRIREPARSASTFRSGLRPDLA